MKLGNNLFDIWNSRLALRSRVNEDIESLRRNKKVGKSLEATIEIRLTNPSPEEEKLFEELFIVSKVKIVQANNETDFTVTRAEDHGMKKCVRCWKYWDHVGSDPQHPELCERCTKVVVDLGFAGNV
jgi:isoleucyl-tRNA synthetase